MSAYFVARCRYCRGIVFLQPIPEPYTVEAAMVSNDVMRWVTQGLTVQREEGIDPALVVPGHDNRCPNGGCLVEVARK